MTGFRRRNTCLLREFAQHEFVKKLVVVTYTTRWHALWQTSWWKHLFGLNQHGKVQDVFVFAFVPGHRWVPIIGQFNLKLARWLIVRALDGADQRHAIQWCYWPEGYKLARRIGLASPIVFDADNDLLSCPILAPDRTSIKSMLGDCVDHAAAVVCGSKQFLARSSELGLKRPTFLRNGVDVARFQRIADEPEDLRLLAHPRVGYVGTLSKWMDYEMVQHLASVNPMWNFVFIGEPYLWEIPQQLKAMPNVHFIGARTAQEVPSYLAHFDVGIVPYRQGAGQNADGDSMKMFEYLAAGLPVVAANFNGRLAEDFEGLIALASDSSGFSRAIAGILSQPEQSREAWHNQRRDFLRRNTWACRAAEALTLMKEVSL